MQEQTGNTRPEFDTERERLEFAQTGILQAQAVLSLCLESMDRLLERRRREGEGGV